MKSTSSMLRRMAFATFGLCSLAQAQNVSMPQASAIVQAQGQMAMVQLQALAAVYSADPSGKASKEAFENGWAPVNKGYSSPSHGWPARGPSLSESVEPLFAQALAAKWGCADLEGPCQNKAGAQAAKIAKKVLGSKNPGGELGSQVSSLR